MTKNVKIPKRIAGVKIPKKARKTANRAIRMGASPMVRELAVAAIGAAGVRGERKQDHGEENGSGRRVEIQLDGARIGEAFRTAAIDGLRRFLEGFEEGLRNINERSAAEDGSPEPRPAGAVCDPIEPDRPL
jgi:hypothetical protein